MENNKMFEPRTIWAVIIVFVGLISWNYFISKAYPPANPATVVDHNEAQAKTTSAPAPVVGKNESISNTSSDLALNSSPKALVNEQFIEVGTEYYSVKVSSFGMGLKEVTLKKYKNKKNEVIQLGNDKLGSLFSIVRSSDNAPLNFNIQKVSDYEVVGTYTNENNTFSLQRTLKFNQLTYGIESQIKVIGANPEGAVNILIPDFIHPNQDSHFLFPSYDHQDYFVKSADKTENINYSMSKTDIKDERKLGHLISLGSQYFSTAFFNTSDLIPDFTLSASVNEKSASALAKYSLAQGKNEQVLSQLFYFGPKRVESLEAVHPEFVSVMNYGFFGFLAHPMLKLMKFFQSFVGNWGLAIILLTLVVRAIVLPFNLMSFKSMKAMQKIQPMMQSLKERYKDDPMALNRETMALMRENKANPLSGCLPMLLQIPIFFALYRVIASSIEIYQQPFVGWISDLSVYDKFFILPILMGVTMFVQQKITPSTTVDPVQAKILLWMPVLFTGLMVFLPSGLTLYMFISSLFGVIQQYFFMKMRTA